MQLSTFQKAFTLLQTIPGVGRLSAATILAETGPDLDSFPTAEQMASWAGLCPGNRESAGIQKGPQTTHGNPYLCTALVQCAWAAIRKRDSVFRSRFQRLAPRRGEKRAIVAVAHHMLVILLLHAETGCAISWRRTRTQTTAVGTSCWRGISDSTMARTHQATGEALLAPARNLWSRSDLSKLVGVLQAISPQKTAYSLERQASSETKVLP